MPWSEPGCLTRTALAFDLFSGTMTGATARAFVADTGARFLLSDCGANADLRATLAPVLVSVHRFGCASVYEVQPAGAPRGALADSVPMRLFALRGAHSVERNDAETILAATDELSAS